jgi:DNA-binding IclR family transcriptional regulator
MINDNQLLLIDNQKGGEWMSADKTLGILDLYDSNTRVLTVSEIAEKLNQPQSSVYRHLRLLKERGYISEAVEGQYRLGLKLLNMAFKTRIERT